MHLIPRGFIGGNILGLGGATSSSGIVYLLNDDFTTPRAAGAVHGTAAEPGPGVRNDTDIESKISISGGRLLFSGGRVSPAFGDPFHVYPVSISRSVGQIISTEITVTTAGDGLWGVFPSTILAANDSHSFRFNSGTSVNVREGGGVSSLSSGSYLMGTSYQYLIALRAAGAFYFIRGGAFLEWTLVNIRALAASPTLYAGYSNSAASFSSDYLCIGAISANWLPVPLVSDGFGSTFGTTDGLGHAEGIAGSIGSGGGNIAYTQQTGTFANSGGKCAATVLDGNGVAIATVPTNTPNVLAYAKPTWIASSVGPMVRFTDLNNYVYGVHDGTNAKLVKRVAGTETVLINTAATYSANADMVIICDGTKFRLYYNNALIGSEMTISDSALQSGTTGIISKSTSNSIDDFRVYARGTEGQYSNLNQY